MENMSLSTTKLTIGMACHDDYDGVYFTIMSLKANMKPEHRARVDFVVVDNNPPESPFTPEIPEAQDNAGDPSIHGKKTWRACRDFGPSVKYVPCTVKKSTSIRDQVFLHGAGEWVLCVDCHVVVPASAIDFLMAMISRPELGGSNDLFHGPMVADSIQSVSTHLDLVWRDSFYGTWQYDRAMMGETPARFEGGQPKFDGPPVIEPGPDVPMAEIPSHGMAFFLCRRVAWLGFCPEFREFGGEEGYIHKKFRKYGHKTWLVPQLLWYHRYHRVIRTYPCSVAARIKNFIRGAVDLGEDTEPVLQAFAQYHRHELEQYRDEVIAEIAARKPKISVITKFHFRAECLPEAIYSFLRQTVTDSELVLVNNNPKTKVVFDHPRVRVINMEVEPESIYQIVEIALRAAKSDWVTFLDDDDIMLPETLASYLPHLDGPYDRIHHGKHGQARIDEFHQVAAHAAVNIHAMRKEFLLDSSITRVDKRSHDWVCFDQDMVVGARTLTIQPALRQTHIYRFGAIRRHMSAQTRDWLQMRREMNAIEVPSEVRLVPAWILDWEAAALAWGTKAAG